MDMLEELRRRTLMQESEAYRVRKYCRLQNPRLGVAGRAALLFARALIALGCLLKRRYSTQPQTYPLPHLEVN
jgi:hypothetical protein